MKLLLIIRQQLAHVPFRTDAKIIQKRYFIDDKPLEVPHYYLNLH